MKPAKVLAELEPLDHGGRVRRMVELGRRAIKDAKLAAVLEAFAHGGWYERTLAVWAAHGSRDRSAALRACADRSESIRSLGRQVLCVVGTNAAIRDVLRSASPGVRVGMLRILRQRSRLEPIDAALTHLAERDDPELPVLLPFGSLETVVKHRQAGEDRGGAVFWSRLARYHPRLATEWLIAQARSAEAPDPEVLRRVTGVIATLANTHPDGALELLRATEPHGLPVTFGAAAKKRPRQFAEWHLTLQDPHPFAWATICHRLPVELLHELLRRYPTQFGSPEIWLRRLPPGQRIEAHRRCGSAWRNEAGCVPPPVLALLPREVRELEATRHLALPHLATEPLQRIPYSPFGSWTALRKEIDPWLRHPDGDYRAASLAALVHAGRFDRARLPEILEAVVQRGNEQDPVRGAFAAALADLPATAWKAEHLAALDRVIDDGLKALDLSWATSSAFTKLVTALVPFQPEWAIPKLVKLAGERGYLQFGDLEPRWNDRDVIRLAPLLAPLAKDWLARRRYAPVLSLAQSLGKRIRVFPELIAILERFITGKFDAGTSISALSLICQQFPKRRSELIPSLIASDASWGTQALVWQHLNRRRQDLLTPFLSARVYKGKFPSGKTRILLPIADGFERWTASQQRLFAETLNDALVKDQRRDTPTSLHLIRCLARIPTVAPATLQAMAGDKRPVVRDAAVRAVGWLDDSPAALDALAAALDGESDRVAMYALRRILLFTPAAEACRRLQAMPLRKVTIAKEVLRLLGEFTTDAALRALQAAAKEPLHRDVRIALLRALWSHLERSEAWALIDEAATSPDAALVSGLARIPDDRLSSAARARLLGLLVRLLDHPEAAVRMELLQRCINQPCRDPERRLLQAALQRLLSPLPNERTLAAVALASMCLPRDADRIAEAARRHRANRRLLVALCDALRAKAAQAPRRTRPVALAVLAALDDDPCCMLPRITLAGAFLAATEFIDWLVQHVAELHAETLLEISGIFNEPPFHQTDADKLDAIELRLATHADERLRRVGLMVLASRSSQLGAWDAPRLAQLACFRNDPSPLVAEAAQFTLPSEEEERLATV